MTFNEPDFDEPADFKSAAGRDSARGSSNSLAYQGKAYKPTEAKEKTLRYGDYGIDVGPQKLAEVMTTVDSFTMEDINTRLEEGRIQLFKILDLLHGASKKVTAADTKYRMAHSRAVVSVSGGTEKSRLAAADIICEDEYSELVVAKQAEAYLKSVLQSQRASIDVITQISHNLRAQMTIQ